MKKLCNYLLISILIFTAGCGPSVLKKGYLIPAPDQPVQVEFERHKDLILIKAEVRGHEGLFLFDNGFSLSAVNKAFADNAGISFTDQRSVTDANNQRSSIPSTNVDTVRIGTQTFVDTGFYQLETDTFFPCKSIDGIIGASIINKLNWHIDFSDQTMQLSSIPFQAEGEKLEFSISRNNSSFTDLTVFGNDYRTKIDFGSTGAIELDYDKSFKSLKGRQVKKWEGIQSVSAHGLGESGHSYELVERARIYQQGSTYPAPAIVGLTHDLKYEAYAGINFFDHYSVTINTSEREYILSAYPSSESESEPEESYGMTAYLVDNTWKIIRLNTSDSLLKDVEVMDEIDAINGKPMNSFTDLCSYREFLNEQKESKQNLNLQLKKNEDTYTLPLREESVTTLN